MRKTITVVVTDLDNTLFDWVEMWYRSFNAMLTRLAEDSKVSKEVLEKEFQAVFQKHGTSEYAFAIQELPSLQQRFPGADLPVKFDAAIHAYNKARKETLRLYPTVLDTLRTLKARGCLIVGYTESMAFYTNYRVRTLGLDGLLDYLYSPEDHDLPRGLTPEQIRHYSPEHYRLHRTIHMHTPRGVLKPSPSILLAILREIGADVNESIYVGDNLLKDIIMAQAAGVTDVYAKYGAAQDRPEYDLLRRVTHWSPETVERERQTKVSEVRPSYVLDKNLGQLLEMFSFERFIEPIKEADKDQKQALIEIWKKTIDVQQHFNDIELRIRNFALTLLVAILGAAGFALKEGVYIIAFQYRVPLAVFLLLAGLIAWLGFYFMDRHWYHRLLYGAVNHGREIEQRARIILPELGLTDAIGRASPIEIFGRKIRSPAKINIFYGLVAAILVILAASSFFVGPRGPTSETESRAVSPTPPATTPGQ